MDLHQTTVLYTQEIPKFRTLGSLFFLLGQLDVLVCEVVTSAGLGESQSTAVYECTAPAIEDHRGTVCLEFPDAQSAREHCFLIIMTCRRATEAACGKELQFLQHTTVWRLMLGGCKCLECT